MLEQLLSWCFRSSRYAVLAVGSGHPGRMRPREGKTARREKLRVAAAGGSLCIETVAALQGSKHARDVRRKTTRLSQCGLRTNNVAFTSPLGAPQSCFAALSMSFTSEVCFQEF